MGKHYIGHVGQPTLSRRLVFKKIAHLVGRLGSGSRLVGRIGSGVRVSASFKKCPPHGSVRVRTPPRGRPLTLSVGRQGRCAVHQHPG